MKLSINSRKNSIRAIPYDHRRKAISPVLATVILIAITLIAAIAIAGFVFGLFGSFTSSAQVSAVAVTCSDATGNCTVNLQNTGSANATPTACTIQISGTSTPGTSNTFAPVTAGAGAITEVCGLGAAQTQSIGSTAQGAFTLSNGATVTFSGTWSA